MFKEQTQANLMEIEVKVRLKDLESVKKKLVEKGAVFGKALVQEDIYFKPRGLDPNRVQGPGEFIIRIRRAGGKSMLTLKELTEILGAWKEHETSISDPTEMENILKSAGFINVFTLNKTRLLGKLGDFEICIDDVKELGRFMEVGLISEEKEETRNRIIAFIKELGFEEKDMEKRGYGEIMGEKLGEKFDGMR